jgi:pimeloyl-ACP methyl ester carboxylesterase
VKAKSPNAKIVYFSSSFGAYINLIYISHRPHFGTKSFLRSAAVNMPKLFANLPPKQESELKERGYFTLNDGYFRPLQISQGFLDDLKQNDLFKTFQRNDVFVRMIHGEQDETISVIAAKKFASQFDIPITIVPEGDHRLSAKDAENQVLSGAMEFY